GLVFDPRTWIWLSARRDQPAAAAGNYLMRRVLLISSHRISRLLGCHAHGSAWACSHSRETWPLQTVAMAPTHAKISFTTRAGSTPVSFWSRPWLLNVKRSWSKPSWCNTVA